MANDIQMPIGLDEIYLSDNRRPVDMATVKRLAESIDKIGLRHPITVRRRGEGYALVAGRHRMEAFRYLKREHIPAIIATFSGVDARLWEIAENLHRKELTVQERSDHIAEWVRLTEEKREQNKPAQLGPVSKVGRGNESGMNAASRELGLERKEVQRAVKIADIAPEAKEEARVFHLDDNQSALLKVAAVAKEGGSADEQIAVIHQISDQKNKKEPSEPQQLEELEEQVRRIIEAADCTRLDICYGYPSQYVIENDRVYWADYDASKEYKAVQLIVMPIAEFISEFQCWLETESEEDVSRETSLSKTA